MSWQNTWKAAWVMQNKATVSLWFITSLIWKGWCATLWCFTDFIHESLSYLQNYPDGWATNILESLSQSIPERREPDRMSEYQERKPASKGLLACVTCEQRNARTSAILSVLPMPCESVSLQKSCYVAGSITFQSLTLPSTWSSVKRHWN